MRKASKGTTKSSTNHSQFWELFRKLVNSSPIDPLDKLSVLGAARARDLAKISSLCEERCSDAVLQNKADRYYAYASVKAAFSKNELFSPGKKGEEAALEKWLRSERDCRRANIRLGLTNRGLIGKQYLPILEKARRIVADIIGDRFPWERLPDNCRHGPGVATGVTGLATSGAFKYAASVYTVTQACSSIFRQLIHTDKIWRHTCEINHTRLEWVEDVDKLQFVAKNWLSLRSIGVGPLGNLYCQLGAGEIIAQCLLTKTSIDIRDQSQNQHAAYKASLNEGTFGESDCTIDLRGASDNKCVVLVKTLLPESWYRVLNCMRTSGTMLPSGAIVRNQKFSAMGNGFTFPLQTLIFYALAQATVSMTGHKRRVLAYGDDLIVPRGAALLFAEVLRWCGFSVNTEKSYFHGDFYESCGTDYLGGVSVRPVFWKRDFRHDRDLYELINRYAYHLSITPERFWLHDLRDHLVDACRKPLLYGPKVGEFARYTPRGLKTSPGTLYECDDRIVTDDRSLYTMKRVSGILYARTYKTESASRQVNDDFAYLQARHGFGSGKCNQSGLDLTLVKPSKSRGADKIQSIRLSYTKGKRWISVS